MRLGYTVRASSSMLLHPGQGVERVRGRMDRHQDQREKESLEVSIADFYGAVQDWGPPLHAALGVPWPCPAAEAFDPLWEEMIAYLTASGLRVGLASYGGWNDGDRAFSAAIWCLVGHLRPERVVETGVAHGLTSRVILQGLERNETGRLWSIDLPAVDSALHTEIGVAVPQDLRSRWSYVSGTSRDRLPPLLDELGQIDLFVHDSLHTGRNTRFELDTAWPTTRPGGVVVVDDIDHSLGFHAFVREAHPAQSMAVRHVTGDGLWGLAVKAGEGVRADG
jgi:predicted O-methyltransferase YrrM